MLINPLDDVKQFTNMIDGWNISETNKESLYKLYDAVYLSYLTFYKELVDERSFCPTCGLKALVHQSFSVEKFIKYISAMQTSEKDYSLLMYSSKEIFLISALIDLLNKTGLSNLKEESLMYASYYHPEMLKHEKKNNIVGSLKLFNLMINSFITQNLTNCLDTVKVYAYNTGIGTKDVSYLLSFFLEILFVNINKLSFVANEETKNIYIEITKYSLTDSDCELCDPIVFNYSFDRRYDE